jgi:hypothetical protein
MCCNNEVQTGKSLILEIPDLRGVEEKGRSKRRSDITRGRDINE